MRKVSREMPAEWALEVMRKAPYITVSFIRKDGSAYGLPLSLASAEDGRVWYFHCAQEGEKLEAIEAHPQVCLSAVSKCSPTVGPKDGSFTLQYRSAVAFGRAEQVFDEGEKIRALRLICERFLPRHMDAFDESVRRSLHRTAVVRITLTEPPTGKRKQYDREGRGGDEVRADGVSPSAVYAVFLGRAPDFLFEEALEMLRVLKTEHVGDLLNARIRLEQGVLGLFDDFQMNVFPGGLTGLGLHQVPEIVG